MYCLNDQKTCSQYEMSIYWSFWMSDRSDGPQVSIGNFTFCKSSNITQKMFFTIFFVVNLQKFDKTDTSGSKIMANRLRSSCTDSQMVFCEIVFASLSGNITFPVACSFATTFHKRRYVKNTRGSALCSRLRKSTKYFAFQSRTVQI